MKKSVVNLQNPLIFESIPMERVWGGRKLSAYGKSLPPRVPIGELWELVDRKDAQSVVHSGPLQGQTLNALWNHHRKEIFGARFVDFPSSRFPLLIKLLDANERLSVQVHPPESMAKTLNGEPKTEVWYFLDAAPDAKIYAGLKRGTSQADFKVRLESGRVDELLHEISVHTGGSIFIPSGRIHAIGEHNVIVEIQQNSDTTYRVYDWNRMGLDGQPRQLHIQESLASIDFDDFEPQLQPPGQDTVADCEFFRVRFHKISEPIPASSKAEFSFYTVVSGAVSCGSEEFPVGHSFLVPAQLSTLELHPLNVQTAVLQTTIP
jgi:mannose-6-phosphate isomerase